MNKKNRINKYSLRYVNLDIEEEYSNFKKVNERVLIIKFSLIMAMALGILLIFEKAKGNYHRIIGILMGIFVCFISYVLIKSKFKILYLIGCWSVCILPVILFFELTIHSKQLRNKKDVFFFTQIIAMFILCFITIMRGFLLKIFILIILNLYFFIKFGLFFI